MKPNSSTMTVTSILTPLRDYSVEDFMKIAHILYKQDNEGQTNEEFAVATVAIVLLTRYEQIKKMKLTKELFVPEAETLKVGLHSETRAEQLKAESVQEKVLFASDTIKIYPDKIFFFGNSEDGIYMTMTKMGWRLWTGYPTDIYNPTVGDLIYHITKYNETATTPINIEVTEQFEKMLIQ